MFVSLNSRAAENHEWLGFALAQGVNAARWGLVRAKGDSLGGAI